MLDSAVNPHPTLSFALDVADKLIKLIAVLLGGIWTYWNYKKSRTYEQKMELQLAASIFMRNGYYIEIAARLKNLGATKHIVQQQGTYCEIVAVFEDLSEQSLDIWPMFRRDEYIEPGETISDRVLTSLTVDHAQVVWLRIDLHVVSGRVEWYQAELVRFPERDTKPEKNLGSGE